MSISGSNSVRWLKNVNPAEWVDFLLISYLYWVAFEWTILSRLGNYGLIQVIRNTVDLIPIVLLLISIIVLNPKFKSPELRIFSGFALIIILSAISLILESTGIAPVTGYIGVTVRFVPLIVLVRYTSVDFQRKLFSQVRIIYWLLAGLGLLSLFGKDWFNGLFLPSVDVFGEVVPTTYKDPGIGATFINTVEFAFFLLGLTIIYLEGSQSKREKLFVSLLSFVLCLLSFSIASVLGLFLIFFLRSTRKVLVATVFTGLLIIAFLFFNGFIVQLLGMDIKYWIEISSEFNRLGYLTKVFPEFLHGGFKDLFLGMGYDAGVVDLKLANYHNTPFVMINNENNLKYLKDVYWLSILIVQGFIAFITTFYILVSVWMGAGREGSEANYRAVKIFILLALFLGMFNQILDMKAFSFCFWLMAGMALNKPAILTEISFVKTRLSGETA
ncbi:MAG: hypothetical protein WC699_06790 [Bacteroidales bacterium]